MSSYTIKVRVQWGWSLDLCLRFLGNLALVKMDIKLNTWLTFISLIINMVVFSNIVMSTTGLAHSVKLSHWKPSGPGGHQPRKRGWGGYWLGIPGVTDWKTGVDGKYKIIDISGHEEYFLHKQACC